MRKKKTETGQTITRPLLMRLMSSVLKEFPLKSMRNEANVVIKGTQRNG